MTTSSFQNGLDGGSHFGSAASGPVEQMAGKLVDQLGFEGARRACRDNQWVGILAEIDKSAGGSAVAI